MFCLGFDLIVLCQYSCPSQMGANKWLICGIQVSIAVQDSCGKRLWYTRGPAARDPSTIDGFLRPVPVQRRPR